MHKPSCTFVRADQSGAPEREAMSSPAVRAVPLALASLGMRLAVPAMVLPITRGYAGFNTRVDAARSFSQRNVANPCRKI
jgi:hypothetical protein